MRLLCSDGEGDCLGGLVNYVKDKIASFADAQLATLKAFSHLAKTFPPAARLRVSSVFANSYLLVVVYF